MGRSRDKYTHRRAVTCSDLLLPPDHFIHGIPKISDLIILRIHDSMALCCEMPVSLELCDLEALPVSDSRIL